MRVDKKYLREFFNDKRVLILGSAPSVVDIPSDVMDSFDIIVRCNNYSFFNNCKRIDVFYTFYGNSVEKSKGDLLNDGVKLIMLKCPNAITGEHRAGFSRDFRYIYTNNGDIIRSFIHHIPRIEDFEEDNKIVDRILTTGVSAIVNILKYKPKEVMIAGFDFFKSKLHNINEDWRPGDGNHNLEGEEALVHSLERSGDIKIYENSNS